MTENTEKKPLGRKIHRGWIVLIVVGLYYATLSGLMINCIGILFAAILKDMGFKTSELSLYYTIRALFSAIIVQRLCRIFDKTERPNVFLAAMGVGAALAFAMMPFYTKVWNWYISALLIGIAQAAMVYMVSVVINNWFKKNQGTIIGFTLMSSGVSAALFGPVCSSLIAAHGWRTACFVIAGISVVTWILPCFFLLVRSPEDVGELPVGADDVKNDDKTAASQQAHVIPSEKIWPVLALGIGLPAAVSVAQNQLATFATSTGFDLAVAGMLTSFCMMGNMFFKMLLGVAADRIGAVNATRIFLAITTAGLFGIMNAHGSAYVVYAGAFFYGAIFSCVVTSPSLICKEMYGDAHYKERLSKTQALSTFVSALTAYAYPELYDIFKDWAPVFELCIFVCLLAIVCLTISRNHVNRLKKQACA